MPSLDEIQQSIETRLIQLQGEITSLEAARAALHESNAATTSTTGGGKASRARAATTTRPKRRARGNAGKRVVVLLAGKLEALLAESDGGLSVAAIVERSGARDAQVRDLLRELESAGRVRRTGVGRGTRWRLVTDEERIAERAAELASLSSTRARHRS